MLIQKDILISVSQMMESKFQTFLSFIKVFHLLIHLNFRYIITCGNDGDIRVWTGIDDDEPESYCVGESAYSIVQKKDYVYVCTDDSKVLMLKYPSCERDGLLTRFTAPTTQIAVAKDKDILACASEDFSVKILNLPQDTNATTFNELHGPAVSLAISSNGKLVAVSSGDGKMYVWNLETKTLAKTIDCVPYTNSFATTKLLCRYNLPKYFKLDFKFGC